MITLAINVAEAPLLCGLCLCYDLIIALAEFAIRSIGDPKPTINIQDPSQAFR